MAIIAKLVSAQAFFSDGTCSLRYGVDLVDDTLGPLGNRGFTVDDPAVTASVMGFVTQMLPTMEAQVGVPVELPDAPVVDETPTE